MNQRIIKLIFLAQEKTAACCDKIHDHHHAARVVKNVIKLGNNFNLNSRQKEALILSAWWHDVGRTVTKRPSIILMPFIDDLISAIMLGAHTLRYCLFGSASGLAARIICCKSLGTGAILSRLLMRKKDRILVNILKDADALDVLTKERVSLIMELSETSRVYNFGLRTSVWWFTHTKQLNMKTAEARDYMIKALRELIEWLKSEEIMDWQIENYGWNWVEKNFQNVEALLEKMIYLNSKSLAFSV